MKFVDQARITVVSGKGGTGSRHFRREKFVPRGGPDGGDGGRGGDVVLVASTRSRTLLDFHHRRIHRAEDGRQGGDKRSTGRSGAELVITVPVGTEVVDEDNGQILADLVVDGQRAIVAVGGIGGRGNYRFRSSTTQAPERVDPGRPGETRNLLFELKLLADVALVGLPNAGKSTLIRSISASRARVADYPFTTLVPNLGVVRHGGRIFTVADIPGLIEGAADGAGLGIQFLRHVERCTVLVFLLAAVDEEEPESAWRVLRHELGRYAGDLLERPSCVALGKADALGPDAAEAAATLAGTLDTPVLPVSGVTRAGVPELLDRIAALLPDHEVAKDTWDPTD